MIQLDINEGSKQQLELYEADNLERVETIILSEENKIVDLTGLICDMAYEDVNNPSFGNIIEKMEIKNPTKGEVILPINSELTKRNGTYNCELRLKDTVGHERYTAIFRMVINANVFNKIGRAIIDNNSFARLRKILEEADKYSNDITDKYNSINNLTEENIQAKENISVLNESKKIINELKTELNEVDPKNAELQKNLKEVEAYIGTLKYSTNLPKMRSDIDKNILRIDQNIRDITKINTDIKDIKENGVIGGGGGTGGNNTAPTISTTFDTKLFTVDEAITIPYFLIDGEGGPMIASYTLNDVEQAPVSIKLGQNKWEVGKLQKGTYRLKIYVKDRGGLFSNQLIFDIQVGALEITSNFNDKLDYKLDEELIIGYNISSMGKQLVNLKAIVDGKETTKEVKVGFNNLNLGIMTKGIHKISLQAMYDKVVSNIITFNIVVTDSNSLYLSTSFDPTGYNNADYISIPYRISLQGQKQFIVHASVNDVDKPILEGILGINQLQLGYLEPGLYTIKIHATTMDGKQTSNVLNFQLNIAQSDFKMAEYIKDGLTLDLSAIGRTNASLDKAEWIDKSPYHNKVTLNGFNFNENGWIDDSLVINGTANCEFDIAPFAENCPKGVTVEFYFKYKENSEDNCRFVDCLSPANNGIYINDEYAYLNSTIDSIKYPLEADEYIHVAYVIDWSTKFEYIYINGCISAATLLYDTTSFESTQKIKIGSCIKDSLVDCAFKNFRVYNRALNHTEILTNFTSCKDITEQKEIAKRNSGNYIPEMNLEGNFDGMGKDLPVNLKIDYRSKGVLGTDFSLPSCPVEWQGDSTLQYVVKNYSIKLYQENGDKFKVKPVSTWPSTHRVWTKANMMDSSSAVSAGIAKMLSELYIEKTPPMMDKKSDLYTVQCFPMLMYNNDKFAGIYNWMLPPKANPLGLDEEKPFNYSFGCEENAGNGIGAFNLKDSIGADKIPTEQDILNGWSCYTNSDSNAFVYFAKLLKWVNDCYWSGTDNYTKFPNFKKDVAKKFNLQFLIDYYINCYVFGLVDSLGKNMQLYSFGTMNSDGDPVWYTTFFDFDTALGCDNKGEFVWQSDLRCPEDYNTPFNLLWEMVRNELKDEIKKRYIEMRRSALTNENFKKVFYDDVIHNIGEKYYNMDALNKYFVWGSGYIQMFHGNKWLEMKKWFRERLVFSDTVFNYTGDLQHTVILRNTHDGQVEYDVKVESPQYITTSFGGASGANDGNVVTKKCTENDYTSFRYSYNGAYQKDAFITSASQITELKGLSSSDLVMLDVQYATKLRELNIDDNPKLTAAHFDNCTNLESFSANNCKSLTSVLNFNNSKNLKSINISDSGVQGIIFDKCLNLENLNITGSGIKSFVSNGIIKDLSLYNNSKLSSLKCINDDKLMSINGITKMHSEQLVDFIIDGCKNLNNLDLLRTNPYDTGKLLNLTIKNKESLKIDYEYDSIRLYIDNVKKINIKCYSEKSRRSTIESMTLINVSDFSIVSNDNYVSTTIQDLILYSIPEKMHFDDKDKQNVSVNKITFNDLNISNDCLNLFGGSIYNYNFTNCNFVDDTFSAFKDYRNYTINSKVNEKTVYIIPPDSSLTFTNLKDVTIKTEQYGKVTFENCKNVTWIKRDGTKEIINN